MKRISILLILLIIAWVGVSFGSEWLQSGNMVGQRPEVSILNQKNSPIVEQNAAIDIPQTIRIPKIDVVANVEHLGLDDQGRMDVPKDADNVGWYKLGYKPGEKGNAVLAGHFDKETGEPAVFWDIAKLGPGDTILVVDSQGEEHTFSFTKMAKYPYDDFPIEEVFGEADKRMLNLITCQGAWDSANKNYSHRIVVSAELVK